MSSVAARLELLCDVNRRLATFDDLDELLAYATSRTRDLFDADGCSLLLIDQKTREFRFPVASQRAGSRTSATNLAEVRFPVTQGIAGWVLANGQAVLIGDVRSDPRFYAGVDASTGTTTRTLLAAPLRTSGGTIGVIEVVNPAAAGDGDADGDLAFLDALGSNIGVAHERAAFSAALRAEAAGLRRLARLAGVVLAALGTAVAAATGLAHGARGLPLRELAIAPGLVMGVGITAAGLVLVGAVRRVPSRA